MLLVLLGFRKNRYVSVAQWIEHWPPTPGVAGSNPVRYIAEDPQASGKVLGGFYCVTIKINHLLCSDSRSKQPKRQKT